MRLIDADGGDAALRAYGPGARDQRRIGRQYRGRRRGARRHAPASSARSPPTSSANSTVTTSTAAGVEFITPASRRRRADRALDDPGHARRAPDDEHLPRRRPACCRRARSTRRRSRARDDPLSRRLSVGSGDAALRDGQGDRGRARRRPQGRLHALRHLLHRPPSRRLQRAARQWPDRHLVRQRGRDQGAGRRRAISTRRSPRCRARSRPWSSPAARTARSRSRGDERADVPAEPIDKLVDTTGAGDLFAAGFLLGTRTRAAAWSSRFASARSPRPKSSRIMAPGPKRTSRRWSRRSSLRMKKRAARNRTALIALSAPSGAGGRRRCPERASA